jgi:hypothetical protein
MEGSLPYMDAAADRAEALMRPLLSAHDSAIAAALSEVSERTFAVAAEAALAAHQARAPPLVARAARMPPVNYAALVAGGAAGSGATPPMAAPHCKPKLTGKWR